MITIYHLGVSQSERIVWLCEELALPYELKLFDRDPSTRMAPAGYKSLHPMGVAPVIRDGDVILAESGAIAQYLIEKYAGGRLTVGPDHKNFADYLFWYHFANGTFLPAQMASLIARSFNSTEDNPMARRFNDRSDRAFGLVEVRLGQAAYFAGDEFTAADIMMLFGLTTMRAFVPRDFQAMPNILAYLKRIGERPAYQRAMAKGDPGMRPMLD